MSDLTQDQVRSRLAQLRAVRDSGVLITRHGETSTQFRSMEELQAAIEGLEGQLEENIGARKRRSVHYLGQRSKGF